ncbi:ABC transporter substrate-binding protein [Desulfitibacter alkalitolerans]|uniref:ABC transporter substrate-binding protein n=1 Tax=Desulfitibacter alkalitolerans TaxID=264641 RepID=UPI0004826067|nr:ABC transporter substrate-binding protein [Desulfitibacter alkalitolerans]
MKKSFVVLVALLLAFGLVLTACGGKSDSGSSGGSNEKQEVETINIGGIFPLTGAIATFGQSSVEAIQLAFEEINAKGGVLGGKQLKFIVEDNRSVQPDSATAAQKLINQDKVVAILGPVASSNSLAAAPIAQEAKIPLLSPTSTNPAVTQVGDFIFRAAFIDPFQGAVMANFALDNLGAKTAAIMTDANSDYSKGLGEVFKQVFESKGGTIVANVSFMSGDTDFNTILTTVRNANPDVVWVPSYYDTAGLILDQAKNNVGFSRDVIFLGADGWDSPVMFELAGDAADGFYFSNHYSPDVDSPEVKSFLAAYQAKYNNKMPDALAALAYDAAYMLAAAIEKAGSAEPQAIRDALADVEIVGVSGQIKLNENRDPVKSAVVIKIENQQQVYYTTVNP